MLVSGKLHAATREELAASRARCEALAAANASLQNSVDWLSLRVNQLEKERAILFREVTDLPIPVPEIVTNPIQTSADKILAKHSLWDGCDDGSVKN